MTLYENNLESSLSSVESLNADKIIWWDYRKLKIQQTNILMLNKQCYVHNKTICHISLHKENFVFICLDDPKNLVITSINPTNIQDVIKIFKVIGGIVKNI